MKLWMLAVLYFVLGCALYLGGWFMNDAVRDANGGRMPVIYPESQASDLPSNYTPITTDTKLVFLADIWGKSAVASTSMYSLGDISVYLGIVLSRVGAFMLVLAVVTCGLMKRLVMESIDIDRTVVLKGIGS